MGEFSPDFWATFVQFLLETHPFLGANPIPGLRDDYEEIENDDQKKVTKGAEDKSVLFNTAVDSVDSLKIKGGIFLLLCLRSKRCGVALFHYEKVFFFAEEF